MSYLVRVIAMASDILTIYYALYRNYRIKIRDILFVEETKRQKYHNISANYLVRICIEYTSPRKVQIKHE